LRNLWSLDPAEAVVACELQKRKLHVFFPAKDVGIDMIVIKDVLKENRKAVAIQVKGSRYFDWKDEFGGYGGWFKLSRRKMERDIEIVDFYVFVLFHSKPSKTGYEKFERDFFIIPANDFNERIIHYYRGGDMVNMYLRVFEYQGEKKIIDYRGITKKNREKSLSDSWRDYSTYVNNWEKLVES
jgi:hypothetical protein